MEILGESEERGRRLIPMEAERSNLVHSLRIPCDLKWGKQRLMRCMKNTNNVNNSNFAGDHPSSLQNNALIRRRRDFELEIRRSPHRIKTFQISPALAMEFGGSERRFIRGDDGIDEVREKLMLDFRNEADKMKGAIFSASFEQEDPSPSAAAVAVRTWNLRTRRASCKAPNSGYDSSPARTANLGSPARALRGSDVSGEKKRQGKKLSVALSRREIEEDFMAMVGRRPHRRPKKRPKNVQRELDTLFPGLWLTEINADLYKVADDADAGKVMTMS